MLERRMSKLSELLSSDSSSGAAAETAARIAELKKRQASGELTETEAMELKRLEALASVHQVQSPERISSLLTCNLPQIATPRPSHRFLISISSHACARARRL